MRAAEAGLWLFLVKLNTRKVKLPERFAKVRAEVEGRGTRSKALGQLDPAHSKVIKVLAEITAEYSRACAKDSQASCPAT